ncbi:hypothetical protein GALL_435960 [mine drainage metagenome]|uniref:Uncharacterized protein n=1 Tax=mine drainage metagenome TaxID=410659 RepID=A0A1J5Q4A8_9ZZZZ
MGTSDVTTPPMLAGTMSAGWVGDRLSASGATGAATVVAVAVSAADAALAFAEAAAAASAVALACNASGERSASVKPTGRGASTNLSVAFSPIASAATRLTSSPRLAAIWPPGSSGATRIGPAIAWITGMPLISRIASL